MNEFDDVSKVEKFVMKDEDYAKREDTFRNFKKKMQHVHPYFTNQKGESVYTDFMKEEAEAIAVGSRCQTTVGSRRGEVKYVGKAAGLGAGYWIGILLDEPTGNSNGTVKGKKLFEAPEGFAVFVRPNELQVGDYPPLDDFDEDEDEIWDNEFVYKTNKENNFKALLN